MVGVAILIRLDWAFCPILAFCVLSVGLISVLFIDPQKSSKLRFQYKYRFYIIIYIFKNYFVIIFLAINF